MTWASPHTWTQLNDSQILGTLDHGICEGAQSYYDTLRARTSLRANLVTIKDDALYSLERLQVSRDSPDYHNPWVALFHLLWYQQNS